VGALDQIMRAVFGGGFRVTSASAQRRCELVGLAASVLKRLGGGPNWQRWAWREGLPVMQG